MSAFIFIAIAILPFNVQAQTDSVRAVLQKKIPQNIVQLIDSNLKKQKILSTFKKVDEQRGEHYYFILNNYKYALRLTFQKERLTAFSYKNLDGKITLNDFMALYDREKIHLIPNHGRGRGQLFKIEDISLGLTLLFKNNSQRKLDRLLWERK